MSTKLLSSKLTFLTKFVFPALWIGLFGLGTLELWAGKMTGKDGTPPPVEIKFLFLTMWSVGSVFIWWTCMRLKQVRVGDQSIYISNYLKEISIPIGMITDVRENRWINIHPVTIHFRGDTEFGQKITFMPERRFIAPWKRHPVVDELRLLAGIH
jgi:hypothetical protein